MGLREPTVLTNPEIIAPAAQPSAPAYTGSVSYGHVPPLRSASTSSVSSIHSGHGASAPASTATIVSSSAAPDYGQTTAQPALPSYDQQPAGKIGSGPMESMYGSSSAPPPAYSGGGGGGVPPPAYGSGSSVRVGAGWGGSNSVPVSSAPAYQAYSSSGGKSSDAHSQTSVHRQSSGGQYSSELSQLAGMGFTDSQRNMALLQKHNGNLQAVVAEMI
eukprot:g3445.t1